MMTDDHSQRIATLEAKLDMVHQTLGDIDVKLDTISLRQMEIDVTTKVAYNAGKWVVYILTTVLGWMNWDQIVAWVQEISHRKT